MHLWFLNSRTKLWMEYVGTEHTRPVPFNIIPSVDDIISFATKIYACCNRIKPNAKTGALEKAEKDAYKKICETLVERYLRRVFGYNEFALPPERDESSDDVLLQKIEEHYDKWKDAFIGGLAQSLASTSQASEARSSKVTENSGVATEISENLTHDSGGLQ